jgi:hypothetical protein
MAVVVAIFSQDACAQSEKELFDLRGECYEAGKAYFKELDNHSDFQCQSKYFKGANYNASDHRCYLAISSAESKTIAEEIISRKKYNPCKDVIKNELLCRRYYIMDVQTKENIAFARSGKCLFNDNMNSFEEHGWIPEGSRSVKVLGMRLSVRSEYAEAMAFMKAKMEDNYQE